MDRPTDPPHPDPPDDDLDYRHRSGRVHYSAHQRGVDATALGQLILLLPGTLMSLLVLLLLSGGLDAWLGVPLWIPPVVWLASGALLFHRPTEDLLARHLLRLHRPMPDEYARLAPVWREVTARAGVDGRTYELWVEDSDHLNAYAAAYHIVGVTRFALDHLPSSQLAAVLAHELGHHTGGTSGRRCSAVGTRFRAGRPGTPYAWPSASPWPSPDPSPGRPPRRWSS